jgi:hypothetical protein
MSDTGGELGAAWGQATSAWWALMAGSWTAVGAVVRAIIEASYDEADITRVNEVEFDVTGGVDVPDLACGGLTRIGPGPVPTTIQAARGTILAVQQAVGAGGPPRAKLRVDPAGAVTGDYVATIRDTSTLPHRDVGRVVVFVLPF